MRDTTFYQALFYCYSPNNEETSIRRNCRYCPLHAQGLDINDECGRILFDEIKHRKCVALRKDEEDE